MQTEWDYTNLAKAYIQRPNYASHAVNAMISITNKGSGEIIACDIGAGVGHLTLELLKNNIKVNAIEPNDAMRTLGKERTKAYKNVSWFEAIGEDTKQDDSSFDLVTFGSSFNVCNRKIALLETNRILKPKGWFSCMWNHRDLTSPIQAEIENIIKKFIPNYDYGIRREDQSKIIKDSRLFNEVIFISSKIIHLQSTEECIKAWRSHGTLQRQAGDKFEDITNSIAYFLRSLNQLEIKIPYETKIWMAQVK